MNGWSSYVALNNRDMGPKEEPLSTVLPGTVSPRRDGQFLRLDSFFHNRRGSSKVKAQEYILNTVRPVQFFPSASSADPQEKNDRPTRKNRFEPGRLPQDHPAAPDQDKIIPG